MLNGLLHDAEGALFKVVFIPLYLILKNMMLYLLKFSLAGDQYETHALAHPSCMGSSGNDVYLNAQSQLKYASNAVLANHIIN